MEQRCPETAQLEASGPHAHRLADMTWSEVVAARAAAPVAIVPLGACEQHGPGMVLRTDTARAEMIADLVAQRISPCAVVAPAIPIGVSHHHLAFPGTLTLTPDTLVQVIQDVVDSLYGHGWRRVFLLTGHGGNNSTVDVAALRLRARYPDLHVAWSGVTPLADDVIRRLDVSEVRGHSCEIETSQALHLDPSLVRPAHLRPGTSRRDELEPAGELSRLDPAIHFPQDYAQLSPTGGLGDPTRASAEMGGRLVERIVTRLATFLEQFAALPDRRPAQPPTSDPIHHPRTEGPR